MRIPPDVLVWQRVARPKVLFATDAAQKAGLEAFRPHLAMLGLQELRAQIFQIRGMPPWALSLRADSA